jgi:hypothetical protein
VTGNTSDLPPRIVIDQTTFDFGRMNPLTTGRHTFTIRNAGRGPLHLLDHRSSCACTVSQFTRRPLAPGESTDVVVSWRTQGAGERFEESVTIESNDPEQRQLQLTVVGSVMVNAGAYPGELSFPAVRPGLAAKATTVVSSQIWSHFQLQNVRSSLEGLTWSIDPATEEERTMLRAAAAQRLTITLPDSLPAGDFTHWLRFDLAPDDSSEAPIECELPIRGKVLRRLAAYGPGIDAWGNLRLGTVEAPRGLKRRLILKVYDSEPELRVEEVVTDPCFLQVVVIPFQPSTRAGTVRANTRCDDLRESGAHAESGHEGQSAQGLYYLDLEIPPDSPSCVRQDAQAGSITVRFDHPRITELQLHVHVAVTTRLADAE